MPTISLEKCRNVYAYVREVLEITNKNICVNDNDGKKYCSFGDSGNPLVIAGKLAGVMSWNTHNCEEPDVFMNLADPEYRNWIISNLAVNSLNSLQRPLGPQNFHNRRVPKIVN